MSIIVGKAKILVEWSTVCSLFYYWTSKL